MESNLRPVPISDPVSAFYWNHAKEGKLAVQGFEGTDILKLPGGTAAKPIAVEVSGRGTLFAFTILHQLFHPGFLDAMPLRGGYTAWASRPRPSHNCTDSVHRVRYPMRLR